MKKIKGRIPLAGKARVDEKNNIRKKRKVKDQEGKKEREITSGALILVPDSLTEGFVSCERTQIAVP